MAGDIDFRRVFEASPEAALLLDPHARVLAASDRYLQLTGLSPKQVIGASLYELPPYLGHPTNIRRAQDLFDDTRDGRTTRAAELEAPASGATAIWTRVVMTPVFDPHGQLFYQTHTLQTTPRTEAQTESDRERRLRKLIEHSYDGIALFDVNGRLMFVSPAVQRMLGLTEQEFAERAVSIIHPQDLQHFSRQAQELLANPGGLLVSRFRVMHKDGSWRIHELATWNLLHDPDVAALVANFHDITEHVKLQEELLKTNDQLQVALAGADAISWTVDLNPLRGWYSRDFKAFFGISEESFAQLGPLAAVHPDERADVVRTTRERFSGSRAEAFKLEFRGIDRPGGARRYATQGRILRDAGGRAQRMVGVVWDNTEQYRLQEERAALDQRMRDGQKLESLGVLAGGIAHDFNNLLMAILGNADLARSRIAPADGAQHFLAQIEAASRRASELCKQMLAYAGKGTFVLEPVSLNRLIDETVDLLQVSISKKTLLRLELDPALPPITADATQVRQVMMNLVLNASEAIEPHSGVISIRTGSMQKPAEVMEGALLAPEQPASTGYAFLEVRDTGHGMSAETQARIFEPFFSTKFAGRGLGLAAVLGIVRSHHGVLKVQSAEGGGSVFTLLLPLAEPVEEKRPEPRAADHGLGRGTVLVVDDEEFVRTAVSQLLEDFGFHALLAHDGEDAIRVAERHRESICAILMDLTMPGLDGEETVRALRERGVRAPVVLMSGYGEQEAVARFHGSGLASFLQKPFGGEELKKKLAKLFA